jgi:hypothetical protein
MWCVHYRLKAAFGLLSVSTRQSAIKAACELIDRGADVSEIEDTAGFTRMNAAEIKHACAGRL